MKILEKLGIIYKQMIMHYDIIELIKSVENFRGKGKWLPISTF